MARQERKYHYIYKITCNVTNRYYIGMHSTDDLNDGYFGSGKRLWFSINYHGKENHIKEILEWLPTRQLLKEREKEMVNKELLGDVLCMNLKEGGDGGFVNEEHREKFINSDGPQKFAERVKTDKKFGDKIKKTLLNNLLKSHKSGKIKYDTMKGKKHSDDTKELMRKSKNVGDANSQYGTCWITNEIENKKIRKGDLIPSGWRLGRKI